MLAGRPRTCRPCGLKPPALRMKASALRMKASALRIKASALRMKAARCEITIPSSFYGEILNFYRPCGHAEYGDEGTRGDAAASPRGRLAKVRTSNVKSAVFCSPRPRCRLALVPGVGLPWSRGAASPPPMRSGKRAKPAPARRSGTGLPPGETSRRANRRGQSAIRGFLVEYAWIVKEACDEE